MTVRISFTPNLERHVKCPPCEVEAGTVGAALDAAFALNPAARSYILDEHGALRKHIALFVDGELVRDLSGRLRPGAELHVMQALSGG